MCDEKQGTSAVECIEVVMYREFSLFLLRKHFITDFFLKNPAM